MTLVRRSKCGGKFTSFDVTATLQKQDITSRIMNEKVLHNTE
ncbi:MAG: hypothetical protein SO424_06610 [[Pasteurella] aerogenes]|nr:hypothetical protein [[Pasteurella] aerogenes]